MAPRDVAVQLWYLLPSWGDGGLLKYPGEVSRGQHPVILSLLQPQTSAAHNLLQDIIFFVRG